MNAITQVVEPLIAPVTWALAHFVWQGVAVAAGLAVSLFVLRGKSAALRYQVACLAMLIMVALPVFTAWSHRDTGPILHSGSGDVLVSRTTGSTNTIVETGGGEPSPARSGETGIAGAISRDQIRVFAFTGWLLGVLILSIVHLVGWRRVQRLRIIGTAEAPAHWQQAADQLCRRLGIRHAVRVVESARVEVPTLIGWLSPVVLIPMGAMTGFSAEQLRSILAHELAHVIRRDYLVNLLQVVAETLLFFHPAVWWVSRQIRIEREHCCDDIAVEMTGSRISYARALVTLEENRLNHPSLAMRADGGSLASRVRRLLGGNPVKTYRTDRPRLSAVLVAILLIAAAGITLTTDPLDSATVRGNHAEPIDAGAVVITGMDAVEITAPRVAAPPMVFTQRAEAPNPRPLPRAIAITGPTPQAMVFTSPATRARAFAGTAPHARVWPNSGGTFGTAPTVDVTLPGVPRAEAFLMDVQIPSHEFRVRSSVEREAARADRMRAALERAFGEPSEQSVTYSYGYTVETPESDVEYSGDTFYQVESEDGSFQVVQLTQRKGTYSDNTDDFDRRGAWSLETYLGQVTLQLRDRGRDGSSWNITTRFDDDEMKKDDIPVGDNVEFELKREAGTFHFRGDVERVNGGDIEGDGRYGFVANEAYERDMEKLGVRGLDVDDMAMLGVLNVSTDYVRDLNKLGYDRVNRKRLMELTIHGVSIDFVKGMHARGYNEVSLKRLVELRIHGVTLEYVDDMAKAGYDDPSAKRLVEWKIHDVSPEYIQAMKAAGFESVDEDELVQWRIHDVDPGFIKEMKDIGITGLTSDDIVQMRIHDVSAEYVKSMKALGYDDIRVETLVQWRIHDVSPRFVKEMGDLGYRNIKSKDLVQMRIHDVSPRYVKELNDLGYKDIRVKDLVRMKIHNVTPRFIERLHKKGVDDLDIDDLIKIRIHGIEFD